MEIKVTRFDKAAIVEALCVHQKRFMHVQDLFDSIMFKIANINKTKKTLLVLDCCESSYAYQCLYSLLAADVKGSRFAHTVMKKMEQLDPEIKLNDITKKDVEWYERFR